MDTQSEIKNFILNDLLSGGREDLDPTEPLFSSGIIDSLGTLRLLTFIEDRFGFQVGDGEVGDENFKCLENIAAFVGRKLDEVNRRVIED